NNIYGNAGHGVYNYSGVPITAENNWWGDSSGPNGEGPGTGDAVSANVDYEPWLAAHVPTTLPFQMKTPTLPKFSIVQESTVTSEWSHIAIATLFISPIVFGDTSQFFIVPLELS
ncbi:unnamed protein product, partial [marine sediment metagenome]